MRELQKLGTFWLAAFILIGSCFTYAKPGTYVSDFVFPTEESHKPRDWEQVTEDQSSEPRDFNGNIKSPDKCNELHVDDSTGNACMIFISYKKLEDPLESLKRALVEELNLPELVYSVRVVKRGKHRLVFELPSAIDALLALNGYCNLYKNRHDRSYEILSVEN
ncbi:uncharacterized protein LOC108027725 [Drosophila biarmipes]|uniref:uncharacterized protein LOC108027725 n=1 Tax=Drosophila biarmipes TaxID=125945 RepID=UPI0007E681DE|nr:uncharacterized protein LOC108027725 [Drosophila biarmipes]